MMFEEALGGGGSGSQVVLLDPVVGGSRGSRSRSSNCSGVHSGSATKESVLEVV